MADFDAIEQLKAAGLDATQLSDAQRKVLADLSQDEVETMVSIREKLNAVGDDVQGYRAGDVGIFNY